MGRLNTLLMGLLAGVGFMYFYDPDMGNRRRALARDRIVSVRNSSDEAIEKGLRDLRNRSRGLLAETMSRFRGDDASDWVLRERVRSELGLVSRHPSAIEVEVMNGAVVLNGHILQEEVDQVIERVSKVRGIQNVDNRLKVHAKPGDIPELQGPGRMTGNKGYWSPSTRLLATSGGILLFMIGQTSRGFRRFLLQGAGLGLGLRGLVNRDFGTLIGSQGTDVERGVVDVRKSITIQAPVEEVYRLWENFENFPQFMEHVKEIRNMGGGRSHWIVSGPAGVDVEFDAVVTEKVPNELIAWETVADAGVKHKGRVRFTRVNGRTRAQVWMTYIPPAGVIGHAVATLFGADPKSAMNKDLVRMKSLIEQGETTARSEKVRKEDLIGGEE